MNKIKEIKNWKLPQWHEDFGEPTKEMELLREISIAILNFGYPYSFKLDCFEEGYISVDVFKNEDLLFDMQVVDTDTNKVGLFFKNGNEHYIAKPSEIPPLFHSMGLSPAGL